MIAIIKLIYNIQKIRAFYENLNTSHRPEENISKTYVWMDYYQK